MIAPGDAPAHEPCTLENADVLGNGVERDCEWRGDFRDARVAGRKALQESRRVSSASAISVSSKSMAKY